MSGDWQQRIRWSADGLIPAIAQEFTSGRVLMLAWMNREALDATLAENRAVYWSRSRARLWRKGEQSGCVQLIKAIRLDCDGDALLLEVEQIGGVACHTGRESCFFSRLVDGQWKVADSVVRDPRELYGAPGDGP